MKRRLSSLLFLALCAGPAAAQTDVPPPPAGSATLRMILSDGGADPARRTAAVRGLPPTLSKADVDSLKTFAFGERPAIFPEGQWHAAVNDMLDVLLAQKAFRSEGAAWLLEMAEQGADPVLRGYALQKLPAAWPSAPAADQEKALKALEAAVRRPFGDSAGTALLALRRLSETGPAAAALLGPLSLEVAGDPLAGPASRSTALQLCAARGEKKAAAVARDILADPRSSVALRVSAVSTLGLTGAAGDRPLLERSAAAHPALGAAASAALKRLPE